MRTLCFLFVCALALSACAEDDSTPDKGDLLVQWQSASTADLQPMADWLYASGLTEMIASDFNQKQVLPKDLPIILTECGTENAFYDPSTPAVFMCYEIVALAYRTFLGISGITDQRASLATMNTYIFILFHELGHAFVDYYDLPITGREEDAVDDYSALLLVNAGMGDSAVDAAAFWALIAQDPSAASFANEHSLSQQRFYNILCIVYGSDPVTYASLVPDALPADRAVRCPSEYEQKNTSWTTLTAPWKK